MHSLEKHNYRYVGKTHTPHQVSAAPANHWGPQWLCPKLLRENWQHLLPQRLHHLPALVVRSARYCWGSALAAAGPKWARTAGRRTCPREEMWSEMITLQEQRKGSTQTPSFMLRDKLFNAAQQHHFRSDGAHDAIHEAPSR